MKAAVAAILEKKRLKELEAQKALETKKAEEDAATKILNGEQEDTATSSIKSAEQEASEPYQQW